MKGIKNENDGKKSLHGIRRNGIRRNGKTPYLGYLVAVILSPAVRKKTFVARFLQAETSQQCQNTAN